MAKALFTGSLSLVMLLFILSGCAEKQMDVEKAKAVVEKHIIAADASDYDSIEKLYSTNFLASEPMEQKKEKLARLKEVMGEVKSKEFIKATHVSEVGTQQQIILEYQVNHSRVNSVEKYTIVEDEGGYKISSYSVESN